MTTSLTISPTGLPNLEQAVLSNAAQGHFPARRLDSIAGLQPVLELMQQFHNKGGQIFLANGDITFTTPEGKAMAGLLELIQQSFQQRLELDTLKLKGEEMAITARNRAQKLVLDSNTDDLVFLGDIAQTTNRNFLHAKQGLSRGINNTKTSLEEADETRKYTPNYALLRLRNEDNGLFAILPLAIKHMRYKKAEAFLKNRNNILHSDNTKMREYYLRTQKNGEMKKLESCRTPTFMEYALDKDDANIKYSLERSIDSFHEDYPISQIGSYGREIIVQQLYEFIAGNKLGDVVAVLKEISQKLDSLTESDYFAILQEEFPHIDQNTAGAIKARLMSQEFLSFLLYKYAVKSVFASANADLPQIGSTKNKAQEGKLKGYQYTSFSDTSGTSDTSSYYKTEWENRSMNMQIHGGDTLDRLRAIGLKPLYLGAAAFILPIVITIGGKVINVITNDDGREEETATMEAKKISASQSITITVPKGQTILGTFMESDNKLAKLITRSVAEETLRNIFIQFANALVQENISLEGDMDIKMEVIGNPASVLRIGIVKDGKTFDTALSLSSTK